MKKEEMHDFEEMEILNMEETEEKSDIEEEDPDDFDEKEDPPFMTVLLSVGVVIALVVIACIVFLIFKSGRENQEETVSLTETSQEIQTEEQTVLETKTEMTSEEEESISKTEPQNQEISLEETESVSVPTESVPDSNSLTQGEPVSADEAMDFTECNDTITAKDVTNLRSAPSTLDEGNIVSQLHNGDTLLRTGINETMGWSRLEYNGQVVYAVNNYLTTDLNYKPPVMAGNPNRVTTKDERVIIFTDHDDQITPKEYVNLRTEPSTSEGDATVRCQVKNGEVLHRTGYSADSGWSRVEYNGEVLYVVSSMVYAVEKN